MADWVTRITESKIADRLMAALLACLIALPFVFAAWAIAQAAK